MTTPGARAADAISSAEPVLAQARALLASPPPGELGNLIGEVGRGRDLPFQRAEAAVRALTAEETADSERAAFLAALREKGETEEEIAAFAAVMRDLAHPLAVDRGTPLVDTCGTGGDGASTFNASTACIFVVAACGLRVAKHGNRAITSKCGSADLLEALGAKIELEPAQVSRCLAEAGIGFLFAPKFHTATRRVQAARKALAAKGLKTVFNLLGPLTNPARPTHQLLGVFDRKLTDTLARVLTRLGTSRAAVVWGDTGDGKGLDEVSITGPTYGTETRSGAPLRPIEWSPASFGFSTVSADQVRGGTPAENRDRLLEVLRTGRPDGLRSFVAANAAAALYVAGAAPTPGEAARLALERIRDGSALKKLEQFVEATRHA
ncbi:MAG: anthranilate phosphoribosyltransferase [Nitrospirae bacterium]|nr:anthranilate phosphoribosyltransferase [Nitrospirota bacterium]